MTETSESRTGIEALSALVPTVIPDDVADPELVTIGERYWSIDGFAEEFGTPIWSEKVRDIDTQEWGQQPHSVAAAGVRAVVPGRTCPGCAGPLSLTSRSAFAQLCIGNPPDCVECTPSLLRAIQTVIDPARKAGRDAARIKRQAAQVRDDARDRWHQIQQEVLDEQYGAAFPSPERLLPDTGVREQIAALALLRYAPSTAPIEPVADWPEPWHPDRHKVVELLGDLVDTDLVRIAASSPAAAFVWVHESFDAARRIANGDLDTLPTPQLTGSYYPTKVFFYVPGGSSPEAAAQRLDAQLVAALNPATMTTDRRIELLDVVAELLAAEAARYLNDQLKEHNLPAVPVNQQARMWAAIERLVEHRSLGEIYSLVWKSARIAAVAAQKNPQARRENMSTHAVNRLESLAKRAVSEPGWEINPFDEVSGVGHGLAAMTRTLFFTILDSDPLRTTCLQVVVNLPAPVDETSVDEPLAPSVHDDERAQTLAWLHAHPDTWNPDEVLTALDAIVASPEDGPVWVFEATVVARGAGDLRDLFTQIAPTVGMRNAALSVLAATAMLADPLVVGGGESLAVGEVLFRRLSFLLLSRPDDAVEDDPHI
ncbi:hypothetical protein [Nocardia salmonicida]|uniref:hypothetical protein n=1 Tax=Nocardia salmonicida TaxID=53431 RepID=UPI0007A49E3B|nr:hypothetical protein [Nocardia salmonicida]